MRWRIPSRSAIIELVFKREWNVPAIGLLTLLGLWTLVGGLIVLSTMLITNPVTIGPVGVTVWFVLMVSVLACGLALVLYAVKSYFRVHEARTQRLRYARRQGWLVAGWIAGILALSSLGQLGWRDVILLGLAGVIIELYVRFRWP